MSIDILLCLTLGFAVGWLLQGLYSSTRRIIGNIKTRTAWKGSTLVISDGQGNTEEREIIDYKDEVFTVEGIMSSSSTTADAKYTINKSEPRKR